MTKTVNINGLRVINGFLKFKRSFSKAENGFVADEKGRYTLDLNLDANNKEHQELILFLRKEQASFLGGTEPKYDVIKAKSYKNKKGEQIDQTFLSLRSRDDVFVMDAEERRLKGDDLIIPFGSLVNAVAEITEYDFQNADGEQMKGISLKLKEVTVIKTPEKKKETTFSR
jgi:hypothetical protein